MKNKLYKPFWILSSIVGFLSAGYYAYSCADGWWDYSSYSNFAPESVVDSSYRTLFYEPYDKFYGYGYMDNASMFNSDIVKDWSDYLNHQIAKEDIEKLLLFTQSSEQDFKEFFAQVVQENPYQWDVKSDKITNFVTFLSIAKQVDAYSNDRYDQWDYEDHISSIMQEDLAKNIASYYLENVKDSPLDAFMKNRMWFQAIKALFYSEDRFLVVDFFNQTSSTQPKNLLYYRALAYVGGAYYQKGDYLQSNIAFAKVFNSCGNLRQVALYNYKPLEDLKTQQTLDLALEPSIKAAILAMDAYYKPELSFLALQRIYEVDSKSEHLDFILSRWVNIQEQEILSLNKKEFQSDKQYLNALEKIIDKPTLSWIKQKTSDPSRLHNPSMWYLVSGYLDIFVGDYKKANENLLLAHNEAKGNTVLQDQIRIFSVINEVSNLKDLKSEPKGQIVTDINWLLNQIADLSDNVLRYSNAQSFVRSYLGDLYQKQGDEVLSEIANPNLEFYADLSNVEKMQDFLQQGNFTEFQKVLKQNYQVNLSELYQHRAILLFYSDNLPESLAFMKQAVSVPSKSFYGQDYVMQYKDAQLMGNPFNGRIKDCNDCDHQAKQSIKYTKESFLEKLIQMQENINNNVDVYNNALLVGNAFYNATYYGNARSFYSSELLVDNSNFIPFKAQRYVLDMSNARKYYDIALQAATNDEQRAKIAYLKAKIQRNEFYKQNYHNKEYMYSIWNNQVAFKSWDGFKELYEKYQDTQYYNDVIHECGYFASYVEQTQAM